MNIRNLGKNTRGAGLVEYATLVGAVTIAMVTTISALGTRTANHYTESAYALEEPILVETGYVSPFSREKALGIAETYRGRVTFMFEDAGYRSALGMYKFDQGGTIQDLQILFENASSYNSGGNLVPGKSFVEVDLRERDQIGFFLASNASRKNREAHLLEGTYALRDEDGNTATIHSDGLLTLWREDPDTGKEVAIRTQYAHNLFYSHANPDGDYAPNADGYPHTVGYVHKKMGVVTLGFEDLFSGGDNDYNDLIIEFDVGRSNASVLDPNLDYDYDGYDTWVNKLRLSQTDRYEIPGQD